jgi:hypothetical protein
MAVRAPLTRGQRVHERERAPETLGIFTTQLSYTFRPRRRPKRLRDKREKYHHSLKALAIREKKIPIVSSPELKIEGTPVYLDVERNRQLFGRPQTQPCAIDTVGFESQRSKGNLYVN